MVEREGSFLFYRTIVQKPQSLRVIVVTISCTDITNSFIFLFLSWNLCKMSRMSRGTVSSDKRFPIDTYPTVPYVRAIQRKSLAARMHASYYLHICSRPHHQSYPNEFCMYPNHDIIFTINDYIHKKLPLQIILIARKHLYGDTIRDYYAKDRFCLHFSRYHTVHRSQQIEMSQH